jgi:hypothetical protein
MVWEQAVADAEAAFADGADAGLSALVVEVDASGQRTLTGTSATPLGNAHDPRRLTLPLADALQIRRAVLMDFTGTGVRLYD